MADSLPGISCHQGRNEGGASKYQDKAEEGGHWYFSRKEIEENSPSKRDGIDWKKETYLRKSYCTFLQDLGMRLKVPQLTIATAIIFCHRFFLRQSHAKNDRRTIATVCMFLAGKVEETPRPLKDVILVSYEIIHKKDPEAVQRIKQKEVYEQQKELILLGERVVLATLGFDLNVHHPYKPLVDAIKKFKVAQNALAQVAWNFVNDGLRTSLCLQFKPHHIAAGAIFLAAKFLKVKLPSDGEKVWWQEFDVTPRQLEDVSNQMLELYEQNRVPPSTNSEAEGSTIGGSTHHATSKASSGNEEPATTNHYYQAGGAAARPGTMKSVADNQTGLPRSSHNQGNDYGVAEMKSASDHITDSKSRDNLHNEKEILHSPQNIEEAQNATKLFLDRARKDDNQESNTVRSEREAGELKDKHFGRNLEHREGTLSQSPQDAIKRIDRDKVKAALEKQRKFRGDRTRKPDFLDEDDFIERELEDGIELAAETEKSKQDRRQSWTKQTYENTHHAKDQEVAGDGEYQGMKGQLSHKQDLNAVEEGEVWAPDDMDQRLHSPKSSSRKRKAWSLPDRLQEGKHRSDYVAGSNNYSHRDHMDDRNRMSRHSHMERDHKRHVPENHV